MTVPGSHVIRQGGPRTGLDLEIEGYEIRDCVHVVTTSGVEQWWLARWPFPGNTIQNLLKHGVGALDIEHCRVGLTVETWPASRNYSPGQKHPGGGLGKVIKTGEAPAGRWPPNLVFLHAEGCKRTGVKKVKGITGGSTVVRQDMPFEHTKGMYTSGRQQPEPVRHLDEDGKETVPEYECVEGCPVATLDVMSGNLHSGGKVCIRKKGWSGYSGNTSISEQLETMYIDAGGASRFFPCFESRDELQAWFDRLLASDPV